MAKRRKPKVFTSKEMSVSEVQTMMRGSVCAWDGCEAAFEGSLPSDWRWLLVYWQPRPDVHHTLEQIVMGSVCDRDTALCPAHARELDGLLKDLGRWTQEPMGGTA